MASTIANVHRGPNAPHYKASQFMPEWRREEKPQQSWQDMKFICQLYNAAFEGEVKQRDGNDRLISD